MPRLNRERPCHLWRLHLKQVGIGFSIYQFRDQRGPRVHDKRNDEGKAAFTGTLSLRQEAMTMNAKCAGRLALVTLSSPCQVHPVIATRWSGSLKGKQLLCVMVRRSPTRVWVVGSGSVLNAQAQICENQTRLRVGSGFRSGSGSGPGVGVMASGSGPEPESWSTPVVSITKLSCTKPIYIPPQVPHVGRIATWGWLCLSALDRARRREATRHEQVANTGFIPDKVNFAMRIARSGGGTLARSADDAVDLIALIKDAAASSEDSELVAELGPDFARGHAQVRRGVCRTHTACALDVGAAPGLWNVIRPSSSN